MQKKYIYYAIIAVVLVAAGMFFFRDKNNTADAIVASHGEFVNKVSISGRVVAVDEAELGFERSGVIERVYYSAAKNSENPQVIKSGTAIAKIDAKDAEKSVRDAEISVESAKLALEKFKLTNSEVNLNADLNKAYDDGFTAVSDAFLDLSTTITALEDILNESNLSNNSARISGNTALSYRNESEKLYYEALTAFKEKRASFRAIDRNSDSAALEDIISKTYETAKLFSDAIKALKNFVDYMADDLNDDPSFDTSKNTLSLQAGMINGHLNALANVQNKIRNYKEAFSSTGLDVKDLELSVRQREVALQDARNKLSDYYIRAPFTGVITRMDAKVGEVASANSPLVTMMSANTFQIESYVPEINIALIKLGDKARVTLDAYGENVFFDTSVVSIDSAETVRDGVSTYKVKLQFEQEDSRIKSGMTANVSVIIFSKQDVIVMPGGVVFDRDGKKFVQIKTDKDIQDREVVLGDVSLLGQVEIVSGLSDGDLVILNPVINQAVSQD